MDEEHLLTVLKRRGRRQLVDIARMMRGGLSQNLVLPRNKSQVRLARLQLLPTCQS